MNEPGMQPLRQRILNESAGRLHELPEEASREPARSAADGGGEAATGGVVPANGPAGGGAGRWNTRPWSSTRGCSGRRRRTGGCGWDSRGADTCSPTCRCNRATSGKGRRRSIEWIELLEQLKTEEPGNGDYLIMLARSYDLRATARRSTGGRRRQASPTASGFWKCSTKRMLARLIRVQALGITPFGRMSHFTAGNPWDSAWLARG